MKILLAVDGSEVGLAAVRHLVEFGKSLAETPAVTLLYVDPPYLGATRGSSHSYRHEMRNPDEHIDLANALSAAAATVILSGYSSPLYDDLYSEWHQVRLAAFTGQGNHSPNGKGQRVEVLWCNFKGSQIDMFAADTLREGRGS